MAAAAYQEMGENRQGAYNQVNVANSVAGATAIVKRIRASAGH